VSKIGNTAGRSILVAATKECREKIGKAL